MTEISPEPNRNEAPRILMPGEFSYAGTASLTSDPTTVYFVSPTMQLPDVRTVVDFTVDVADADDQQLQYNIFVTGPAPNTGFDGGTSTGLVTRRITASTVTTGVRERRASITRTIAGDSYFDSVRSCYRVEFRISSAFLSDGYTPITAGDVASISFWVGSISSPSDVVDLSTCRNR